MQADVVAGADRQTSADLVVQLRERAPSILDVLQGLACVRQQGSPGVGEADATTDTAEQRLADLLFERGDALADGRLRHVPRSEERRVGTECVSRVDLGCRLIIKKKQ